MGCGAGWVEREERHQYDTLGVERSAAAGWEERSSGSWLGGLLCGWVGEVELPLMVDHRALALRVDRAYGEERRVVG